MTAAKSSRKSSRKVAPAVVADLPAFAEGCEGESVTEAQESGEVINVTAVEVPDAPVLSQSRELVPVSAPACAVPFSARLVAALTARSIEAPSRDTDNALSLARSGARAIDRCMSLPEFAPIADRLLVGARQAHQHEGKLSFIAVKVLVKLVKVLYSVGVSKCAVDPYTAAIVGNMIDLHVSAGTGITNKGTLVALSRSVEFDELDQVQLIRNRRHCSPGTASTQASSTRMTLHYLGIAEVVKGKQGDVMSFDPQNGRAVVFTQLFNDKLVRAIREGAYRDE